MNNTSFRIRLLVIAGIVSIGLSIYCFNLKTGEHCSDSIYGGDAYTGMQNASAATARNVNALSEIVKNGLGCILLAGGLALIAFSVPARKNKVEPLSSTSKQPSDNINDATTEIQKIKNINNVTNNNDIEKK